MGEVWARGVYGSSSLVKLQKEGENYSLVKLQKEGENYYCRTSFELQNLQLLHAEPCRIFSNKQQLQQPVLP